MSRFPFNIYIFIYLVPYGAPYYLTIIVISIYYLYGSPLLLCIDILLATTDAMFGGYAFNWFNNQSPDC